MTSIMARVKAGGCWLQRLVGPTSHNQIPNVAYLKQLDEKRCSVEGLVVEVAYRPTFADWLHWLESDQHLLMKEAGSPRKAAWMKNLLARWREAGRPCPSEWQETRNLDWLRPVRSSWPETSCWSNDTGER